MHIEAAEAVCDEQCGEQLEHVSVACRPEHEHVQAAQPNHGSRQYRAPLWPPKLGGLAILRHDDLTSRLLDERVGGACAQIQFLIQESRKVLQPCVVLARNCVQADVQLHDRQQGYLPAPGTLADCSGPRFAQ